MLFRKTEVSRDHYLSLEKKKKPTKPYVGKRYQAVSPSNALLWPPLFLQKPPLFFFLCLEDFPLPRNLSSTCILDVPDSSLWALHNTITDSFLPPLLWPPPSHLLCPSTASFTTWAGEDGTAREDHLLQPCSPLAAERSTDPWKHFKVTLAHSTWGSPHISGVYFCQSQSHPISINALV